MTDEDAHNSLGSNTEFIIQTRSRRSNAGNKLQKLLEQELRDIESTKRQLSSYNKHDDDDQDEIGLLFQEDDDDDDFEITEKDDNDVKEDNETANITEEPFKVPGKQATDDLMFSSSESEDSNNEDDDEEEEKELRRQELLSRKKRNKKLQKGPVIIKKQKPKSEPVKKVTASRSHHSHEQLNAETLLLNTRRTSKRSSVMKNTMKVYEKLSKAEKKRKIIQERIRKHKEKESQYILTQEERLRIAKETEKLNILSLDKFKEQEVWKKENRLALQKRQKLKFQPNETILQILSTTWLMTPSMEVDDRKYWQEQLDKRDKKKKKYPRKPRKNSNLCQQDASNNKKEGSEGSIGDNNSVKPTEENFSIVRNQEATTTNETSSSNEIVVEKFISDEAVTTINLEGLKSKPLFNVTSNESANEQNSVDEAFNDQSPKEILPTVHNTTCVDEVLQNFPNKGIKNKLTNTPESKGSLFKGFSPGDNTVSQNDTLVISPATNAAGVENTMSISINTGMEEDIKSGGVKNEDPMNLSDTISQEVKSNTDSPALKQVTFTDAPQVDIIDTEESPSKKNIINIDEPSMENSLPTPIYEGPEQLTSRTFITLYDFPNTAPDLKDVNANLFGSQWSNSNALSTTQRPQDIKTVFHSILPSPSQSSVPSPNVNMSLDLSVLDNFPSFGEYDKKIVHQISTETNKDLEIKIKTQPPTGVFLANGIRKKCLITNKECQYFDPRTGVPYSDVEAYKIIQQIQDAISKEEERTDSKIGETENEDSADQARFKWFGFKNGGIYLDLDQKPAKGVPEGF
ncbi:hypothetical protein SMKI_04G6800 [Saccharomyces mikatae IFO 1815]|uniref:Vps72/YL1 C-terminal domain-containing protein n=1 Tax=Saccharomyces mikatae IFO 1815 TaxID=226126 RepID=A0AA35IYZ3_SACMI|nr:uncharacterized protein SMKI_04G6800 [Saccharomyces mikatae IFO 1815]CAI4038336.1 hypothetical protein SMKI_04G6800 [Saccharomyces mikatae IFO 1815]